MLHVISPSQIKIWENVDIVKYICVPVIRYQLSSTGTCNVLLFAQDFY